MTNTVINNREKQRYELAIDGHIAFANYRRNDDSVIITHTETPVALRGHGVAAMLIKGALEQIRAERMKVVAACGYVMDYLAKHPEFSDLVE